MIYLLLFVTFFKIGLFTFGGGYAMIPLIREEVFRYGWLSDEQIIDFIAIAESTPGPFAINIATFVGMNEGSFLGAFLAVLGVVLPSFIVILLIARLFIGFSENLYVNGALKAARPAAIGLIASVGVSLFFTDIIFVSGHKIGADTRALLILAILIGIILLVKKLHPALLILFSALLGILFYGLI